MIRLSGFLILSRLMAPLMALLMAACGGGGGTGTPPATVNEPSWVGPTNGDWDCQRAAKWPDIEAAAQDAARFTKGMRILAPTAPKGTVVTFDGIVCSKN